MVTRLIAATVFLTLVPMASLGRWQSAEEAWVRWRVEQVKHSEARKWERIPWVDSLLEARRLSKEEGRPLFLFTQDGNLQTGRC